MMIFTARSGHVVWPRAPVATNRLAAAAVRRNVRRFGDTRRVDIDPSPVVTMAAMLAGIVATSGNRPPSMKRRSRRILLIGRLRVRVACVQCGSAGTVQAHPHRQRRCRHGARRPHVAARRRPRVAAGRASKSPMTAAPHCKRWWPDIHCGSNGSVPSRTATAAWSRLLLSATPKSLVQQAMLEQGRARVAMRVGGKACADALLSAENSGAGGPPWAVGRSQFCPFVGRKSARASGRARPVRVGGRQGLVGARKRGHYICEFRAPLDAGLHRDHFAASAARVCRGGA